MKSKHNGKKVEKELKLTLKEGNLEANSPEEEAVDKLIPRYESRIQAQKDPITEETKIIQKYIEETNEKYLTYGKKDEK